MHVGGTKTQPVVVTVNPDAISGLPGFGQVSIRAGAITSPGSGKPRFEMQISPGGQRGRIGMPETVFDARTVIVEQPPGGTATAKANSSPVRR